MSAVDLHPIYNSVVNPFIQYILQGLALAIVGWFTWLVQKYAPTFAKGFLESKASKDLNTALQNGVIIAMHQVDNAEQAHESVQVQGAIQRIAVQYAVDHAPGAIGHFGLSPDQLAVKALAYIPTPPLQISTPIPVDAKIEVQELPPIPGAKTEAQ